MAKINDYHVDLFFSSMTVNFHQNQIFHRMTYQGLVSIILPNHDGQCSEEKLFCWNEEEERIQSLVLIVNLIKRSCTNCKFN